MSDGLDVHSMTGAGRMEGKHVSMLSAFASVSLAAELHGSAFDVLPRIWRYAETIVPASEIGKLLDEVDLIASKFAADPEIAEEMGQLRTLLHEAIARGTGICAQGP